MRLIFTAGMLAAMLMPVSAQAAVECPSSYICASNPQGLADTLRTLGYRADLGKSEASGNPKISSAASGYNYTIYFYGCENGANCNSIGFMATFDKDKRNSAELANDWNRDKRFSTMSFDPNDGTITLSYDVTTIGGISQVNFADVISWWEAMLGQIHGFLAAQPQPKK